MTKRTVLIIWAIIALPFCVEAFTLAYLELLK
jgi:hypothetical protein